MTDLIIKCEVCQSLIDEEDLFCANCGTEAPRRAQQTAAHDTFSKTTHNFQCNGCGASMSYDAKSKALHCPFCGSNDMTHRPDAKVISPRRVVPLKLARDAAVEAMRRFLGRGFFRPSDLAQSAAVVEMTAVYVPYWVFRADTHTYWTADTSQKPITARGDWCPLAGEHWGHYSGLLIGASGALTPAETNAICPFDLTEGKPPEEVDLENATVEQFSLQRKYARPLARQGLDAMEALEVDKLYVPARARNVHVNVRIEEMSSEPTLLPVWIMAYRHRDRLFRFLVNAQTGKATGQAPTSILKLLGVVGLAIAAVILLLILAGIIGGGF